MSFFIEVFGRILEGSGFAALPTDWRQVVMILLACLPKAEALPLLYPIAGWGTLAASAVLLAAKSGVLPAALTEALHALPLYAQGLGWLLPCLVFLALGAGLSLVKKRS